MTKMGTGMSIAMADRDFTVAQANALFAALTERPVPSLALLAVRCGVNPGAVRRKLARWRNAGLDVPLPGTMPPAPASRPGIERPTVPTGLRHMVR